MPELIETYWPYILLAVVIGFAVGWYVFVANRKTSVTSERRDVLDEGAERARRNEALINAPPAAENLSNPANTQQVAHATALADAEAGASVPSTDSIADATEIPPAPAPSAAESGDDLTRIKGLGPKIAANLKGMGINSFAQIAAWDDEMVTQIDAQMGRFTGRIRRDNWVEQAKLLAAGDEAGFAQQFGQDG